MKIEILQKKMSSLMLKKFRIFRSLAMTNDVKATVMKLRLAKPDFAIMLITIISILLFSCETEDAVIKQFPAVKPCPEIAVVNYEGEDYPTVQIGNQCWMSKNLNIGSFMVGDIEMTNNNQVEKYCYINKPSLCSTYGGLYQWDEMMQYTNAEGSRGICPEGWHIPTKQDLEELLLYVENNTSYLKDTLDPYWYGNRQDNSKKLGFNARTGGGFYVEKHEFYGRFYYVKFWTSSESDSTSATSLKIGNYSSPFNTGNKSDASYVRCIKDE